MKKVNILIALMVMALAGIIIMQLIWMNNAVKVRNELFDRSVNEAMLATSRRVETLHEVVMIREMMEANASAPFKYGRFEHGLDSTDNFDSIMSEWHQRIAQNQQIDTDEQTNRRGRMRNFNAWGNRRPAFGTERLRSTAQRMVFEAWTKGLKSINDTATINQVLYDELLKRDVNIAFRFGVVTNDTTFLLGTGVDLHTLLNKAYSSVLYPNNILGSNERLLVYFPGQKAFVVKSMLLPAALSLIFSLFIVVVFTLSIYYIVSQKKLSEMKSDFINNMTHEFKTPLATISVAADTIINPKIIAEKDKVEHFVAIIKNENKRMNQQVETILQMARFDRDDFDFKFEVLNVHDIIEKAVGGLLLQVESRGGFIKFEKNAVNTMITADAQHIRNLFNNLIDNANKYSPEKPEIEITTRNNSAGVLISIADKGIGMSKHVQQRIFERFFRETSGNIHNVKGFGLGLSYVKAVVDAHKGEIIVQSEVGKGSLFEVFLPFTSKM